MTAIAIVEADGDIQEAKKILDEIANRLLRETYLIDRARLVLAVLLLALVDFTIKLMSVLAD